MFGYERFQVEDFVMDPRFRRWVNHPTPPEDAAWEEWLLAHPGKRETVEQARYIVRSLRADNAEEISETQIEHEVAAILTRADAEEGARQMAPQAPARPLGAFRIAAAASIALILGSLWWFRPDGPPRQELAVSEQAAPAEESFVERVNETGRPLLVNLPDKSTVILQKHGRVRYPRDFEGDKREVFLEGEAFFEVTKNAQKPFYVYAGKLVTKVLGTSFSIAANPLDNRVTVLVKTGRVSVFTQTPEDSTRMPEVPALILTPNQQAVYGPDNQQIVQADASTGGEPAVPVPDTDFTFRNTPVTEALALMEQAYSIPIQYEAEALKGCDITASFTDEPFAVKLDLICRTIGVAYRIEPSRVVITGKGCGL